MIAENIRSEYCFTIQKCKICFAFLLGCRKKYYSRGTKQMYGDCGKKALAMIYLLCWVRENSFDYLKLDREFLAGVEDDKRGQIVISSVVRMARELEMPVVVEGVETEQQKDFVSKIGCVYIQGYFFAKPMPAEEYEKMI
ncbi:MAG: EAL domain-containing protein [Lachnospiraceae bacterium]|nr:EAL domain-containing protein [Lachnospiraceae bacterium]